MRACVCVCAFVRACVHVTLSNCVRLCVGLWHWIVAFPGHTHSLFGIQHVCLGSFLFTSKKSISICYPLSTHANAFLLVNGCQGGIFNINVSYSLTQMLLVLLKCNKMIKQQLFIISAYLKNFWLHI